MHIVGGVYDSGGNGHELDTHHDSKNHPLAESCDMARDYAGKQADVGAGDERLWDTWWELRWVCGHPAILI